jgi:hypothetical protein
MKTMGNFKDLFKGPALNEVFNQNTACICENIQTTKAKKVMSSIVIGCAFTVVILFVIHQNRINKQLENENNDLKNQI